CKTDRAAALRLSRHEKRAQKLADEILAALTARATALRGSPTRNAVKWHAGLIQKTPYGVGRRCMESDDAVWTRATPNGQGTRRTTAATPLLRCRCGPARTARARVRSVPAYVRRSSSRGAGSRPASSRAAR